MQVSGHRRVHTAHPLVPVEAAGAQCAPYAKLETRNSKLETRN